MPKRLNAKTTERIDAKRSGITKNDTESVLRGLKSPVLVLSRRYRDISGFSIATDHHDAKSRLHIFQCMQSLTFLQFYEHCKCNYASNTHGQVHVHAGMAYKFNHDMHACFARNLATLNHCHIVAIGMTLFQLPKSLILEVLSIKHWRQSAFAETPLTVRHSRDARRRRASMLVIYISVKMAAPWSSLTLLSYYSLCPHLRSR